MTRERLFIVTGVNRGLGKAVFDLLLEKKQNVLALSRQFTEGQCDEAGGRVRCVSADLSKLTEEFLEGVFGYYSESFDEVIFINNASTIQPIGKIGTFSPDEISNALHLNVAAPLLIANNILRSNLGRRIRVVNVSSGAARRPIEGWSLYSATKAANEMFFNVLEKEKQAEVINFDPGVLNTGMQEQIRKASEEAMPEVNAFRELHEGGKLKEPAVVAREVWNLLKEK
ncbi:MAG: SDR family NAD(P)-dependent oxidoreductase [Cytophagales bacterium]|nr:SDR family NAD(P)-dependent oxidoreductase [Cytophagales bacterium]